MSSLAGQTANKGSSHTTTTMKRSLTFLIGLVSIAATGGSYTLLETTPDQVIHQNVSCPITGTANIQDVEVLSRHRWEKGMIVLYSAVCTTKDTKGRMQRVFGHQVVKRQGMNWQVSSSDSYSISHPQQSSEKLIEYGISQAVEKNAEKSKEDGDRYTILYGQFLTPQVSAVEVTFDNGQVIRDEGEGKAFALISTGAASVCELRILGPDNQLLRKEDLTNPDPLFLPKKLVSHQKHSPQCFPTSRHL
ncbi:MAG: hypothetical protein IGS48_17550 [Oscillatoriales cyanobacterium C42_A2020_001]|nr:hypothetical protein [Leptolyngbyaceae cyanobacterium C42_A2020_001]